MSDDNFSLLTMVGELDRIGKPDSAIDFIINAIDGACCRFRFREVDRLLDAVHVTQYSTTVMLAFLTASFPARDKLEAYIQLYERIETELEQREPGRAAKLLKGLEPCAEPDDPLRTVCQSAIAAFGTEYQLRKTQEECCELGAEIAHWLDGKISAEKLAKEAADVEITATYVRLAIGDALVDEAKARKLERLRGIVRVKMESDNA